MPKVMKPSVHAGEARSCFGKKKNKRKNRKVTATMSSLEKAHRKWFLVNTKDSPDQAAQLKLQNTKPSQVFEKRLQKTFYVALNMEIDCTKLRNWSGTQENSSWRCFLSLGELSLTCSKLKQHGMLHVCHFKYQLVFNSYSQNDWCSCGFGWPLVIAQDIPGITGSFYTATLATLKIISNVSQCSDPEISHTKKTLSFLYTSYLALALRER